MKTPINSKAIRTWTAEIMVAGGSEKLDLSDEEAEVFNADPDAFAARHVGLSLPEYVEWIETGCCPLCAGRTKTGRLCRMQIAGMSDAQSWKAKHRVLFCSTHDPEKGV